MSEPMTALEGVNATETIEVADAGLVGMITLRADLADDTVRDKLSGAGLSVPEKGMVTGDLSGGAAWMSPDELLVFCAFESAEAQVNALTKALKDTHSLVVNVSDARAMIRLSGDDAAIREVLAKLSPADLSSKGLSQGQLRRTRLAQVPAAFWVASSGEANVICFRSVAGYVFGLLKSSSTSGSEVGYF